MSGPISEGRDKHTLVVPLSIQVVTVLWHGSRENWSQEWAFELWPLQGRGTIMGGTGATYIASETGEYLFTKALSDEFVPIEPFVVTLKRGIVNEIWIEMNRRDGKPIHYRDE